MKVRDIQTRHPIPEEDVRSQSDAQNFFFRMILPRLLVPNNRSDSHRSRHSFVTDLATHFVLNGARPNSSRGLIDGGVVRLWASGNVASSCPQLLCMLSEDVSDAVHSGESDSHNFQLHQVLLRPRINHTNGEHFVNTKGQRKQS